MRSLRFLLSLLLLGFAATLAQADGDVVRTKSVALPVPQASVAVTVERGVRVWRPLGTDASGEAYYPQAASVNSGSEPQPQYVAPNSYGVTGTYGGIGGFGVFGQANKHERRNGVFFGSRQVTRSKHFSGSKHVNITIKGWAPRSHGPMKIGHSGGRHGGMGGGGAKHVAFVGKGSGLGGGAKHGGGRGHGHR
jgi:hypothetical protein